MNIGEKIDNYLIEDEIGEGGMGCVLKARDTTTGHLVALKYCKDTNEKAIKRFKREVRIASETKHQNVIEIIDTNLENIPPYFVMPLARASVHDVIGNIQGDFSKVIKLFEPICRGVSALHNSGKFHRDIKPRNALIMSDGNIKIADFGLAKFEKRDSSTHTSSNDFLGTFGYHAPEQFEAKNSDARTDVFQLGKCFYEMFTSDYPYLINSKKIPSGLAYIIQKATSPDPDDRFQSVSDFLQAIKSYEKSLNPKQNPKDALENKILEIKKLLDSGLYREDLCAELLDLLGNNKDDTDLFIDYFDKIPNQIVKVLSKEYTERFEPILNLYTEKLSEYFKNNFVDFSYAETVASKMSAVFESAERIDFMAIAIRNTLRAAVWCNRFNAMDTFNHLLRKIKNDEVAGHIAQVLNEEIELYSEIADQSADNDLHPTLVDAKKVALDHKQAEKERRDKENEDWLNDLLK